MVTALMLRHGSIEYYNVSMLLISQYIGGGEIAMNEIAVMKIRHAPTQTSRQFSSFLNICVCRHVSIVLTDVCKTCVFRCVCVCVCVCACVCNNDYTVKCVEIGLYRRGIHVLHVYACTC